MRKLFGLFIIVILCFLPACTAKTLEKKTDPPMVVKNNEGYTTTSLTSNTPAKVYSSIPIVEGFSLEDAIHQQMFVLGDDGIISGKKYWDKFYLASLNHKNASLMMAMYYKESADGDNTPVIYIEKLTYSSLKGYILSSFSDVFRTIQYPYLIAVSGSMPNSNIIMRNYYLVQNPNLTFEKLNKSVYSSNSRDQIASNMVWFEKLCDDATKRIDKLYQIQKGSTREQVHELLGKPEQVLPTGIYTEIYYLGNNNRATLQYFSDNITIEIYYEDTKKVVNVIPK